MCSLLLLSPAAERWIHTSPKPLCDTEIAVTWQQRNARLRTSTRRSVCAPACHFVRLNRCICLPAVGECSALFLQTLGGALAVELRLCVNQTASRAPPPHCTNHHPPTVWGPVLLLSHAVILNSFHLYLCFSQNPSIVIIYSLRNLYWLKSFFLIRDWLHNRYTNVAFRQNFWHLNFFENLRAILEQQEGRCMGLKGYRRDRILM